MSDDEWKPETKEGLRRAGGAKSVDVNASLYYRTLQTAPPIASGPSFKEEAEIVAVTTGHLMAAFKPTDAVEGMFASTAVMLHSMAMEAGRRAMIPEQPADVASKLRKDAANGARAFSDMVSALAQYRGKGPQVVRVERVIVNEGGQAIVGPVSPGGPLPAPAPAPQAIGQGPAPMSVLTANPVEAGEGEGHEAH